MQLARPRTYISSNFAIRDDQIKDSGHCQPDTPPYPNYRNKPRPRLRAPDHPAGLCCSLVFLRVDSFETEELGTVLVKLLASWTAGQYPPSRLLTNRRSRC